MHLLHTVVAMLAAAPTSAETGELPKLLAQSRVKGGLCVLITPVSSSKATTGKAPPRE